MTPPHDPIPVHLTDARLQADLTDGIASRPRRARILLTVPAEGRQAVEQDAWYTGNMIGGRPSDNLASAADAYLRGRPLAGPLATALDPRGEEAAR